MNTLTINHINTRTCTRLRERAPHTTTTATTTLVTHTTTTLIYTTVTNADAHISVPRRTLSLSRTRTTCSSITATTTTTTTTAGAADSRTPCATTLAPTPEFREDFGVQRNPSSSLVTCSGLANNINSNYCSYVGVSSTTTTNGVVALRVGRTASSTLPPSTGIPEAHSDVVGGGWGEPSYGQPLRALPPTG